MSLFLLKNTSATAVHATKQLLVQAETAADARLVAAARFNGDASWADSTSTAITATTLDTNASMLGWTWNIVVTGGAAQTPADDPVSVTHVGTGVQDLDDVAAALVTLLNATTDIANAAYAAPNLTVSSIADGIGDASVYLTVTPPSGNTKFDLSGLFTASITHEGVAAAALVIALVADTESAPSVLAEA